VDTGAEAYRGGALGNRRELTTGEEIVKKRSGAREQQR
jgi:hypothetical protein